MQHVYMYIGIYIYFFFGENTLGECRLKYFESRKKKERNDWREEKMTTATQPENEPRTTRFPGDCSSS